MTDRPTGAATAQDPTLLRLAARIASAYLSGNPQPAAAIGTLITTVYATLSAIAAGTAPTSAERPVAAVPVRRSVTPDYIVCLEDGRRLKMLKRYLRAAYGLTPDEYRARWNLPAEYPMVAPNYARHRSDFAKKMGLGKRPGA